MNLSHLLPIGPTLFEHNFADPDVLGRIDGWWQWGSYGLSGCTVVHFILTVLGDSRAKFCLAARSLLTAYTDVLFSVCPSTHATI